MFFHQILRGVLSTFAITMVDNYDEVIQKAAEALQPGGYMVIFEMKQPQKWPKWIVQVGAKLLGHSFGPMSLLEYSKRTPWKSINQYLDKTLYKEFYGGLFYLCAGQVHSK